MRPKDKPEVIKTPPGRFKLNGRPKGVKNKFTRDLQDAIMNAFEIVGGENYLVLVAEHKPEVFCALLARVLPAKITGSDGKGPVEVVEVRSFAPVAAAAAIASQVRAT